MNGEAIVIAKSKIKKALERKQMKADTRLLLEVLEIFVLYLENDHPKTVLMFSVFKPMAWFMTIFTTGFIGLVTLAIWKWLSG